MVNITLARLQKVNEKNISAAGARYTPAMDEGAPNLEIASLLDAIAALGHTNRYHDTISTLVNDLSGAWKKSPTWIGRLFSRRKQTPNYLIGRLKNLPTGSVGGAVNTLAIIRKAVSFVDKRLREEENAIWQEQRELDDDLEKYKQSQCKLRELRELKGPISSVKSFTKSPSFALLKSPRLFIIGEWGTGKTHFLCDVTRQRQAQHLPTLFLLAHRLTARADLLHSICESTGLTVKPNDLLQKMDALGKRSKCRALIVIDGINEADRSLWKQGIRPLAREVSKYPHVGLVVSCRSPFDRQIMDTVTEKFFVKTNHYGFEAIEFDAQSVFFEFYSIPHPHVPMLVPEFTRPLFLHTLCKSLAGKTRTTKSRTINAISSGQRGMTKVLEDFVRVISKEIENDFGLPNLTCWKVLKGDPLPHSGKKYGIAVTMAKTACDFVKRSVCVDILKKWTGFSDHARVEAFLQRMLTDGLLAEDVLWISDKMEDVIRMPFQRFSDHLICRHLLDTYLKKATEQEIRRSFYRNKPLGKVFEIDEWGQAYSRPNLATALMLEFPERVKRVLPKEDRELVFYLPKRVQLVGPLQDVFLEGLLWRSSSSFTVQTDHLISLYLTNSDNHAQRQVLEVLVCLASRLGHPYSSDRLLQYLESKSVVDRDLLWSEFLRTAESSSVVHRLLDWVEGRGKSDLGGKAAKNVIRLCSLYLTTSDRTLRDRATKSLVLLGEQNPGILFDRTVEALGSDDPYIPERLLAASYGVLMRQWVSADQRLTDIASEFSRRIYDAMFAQGAPSATSHILMRDYALGIIQIARKLKRRCLGGRTVRRLLPPYPASKYPIPARRNISNARCADAKSAILMDFGNYSIGSLVQDRGNYDYSNKEYQGVVRQIKWRILNLGYTEDAFKTVDQLIGQMSFEEGRHPAGSKTDRYGKKYSWIAFFEVSGIRADAGVLPHFDEQKRASDADIDPSFPKPARKWQPPLRAYFRKPVTDIKRWIGRGSTPKYNHLLHMKEVGGLPGPWTLLDGFITERSPGDHREVFTFLRGALTGPKDITDLKEKFLDREYPGNHAISDAGSDYYAYAGEIPWRQTVGTYLRSPSGKLLARFEEVFGGQIHRKLRKSISSLTAKEYMLATSTYGRIRSLSAKRSGADRLSDLAPETIIEIDKCEQVPGVRIEIPDHRYDWSENRSAQNQNAYFHYPALSICDNLNLNITGDMNELVDSHGRLASIYREFSSESSNRRSWLLYLRADLLSKYQQITNRRLVWLLWGERSLHYSQLQSPRSDLQSIWADHLRIHRTFVK